ncbi:MAG TPA: hypothetical protein VIJ53_04785 [Acidobacteriaceae bacterium]
MPLRADHYLVVRSIATHARLPPRFYPSSRPQARFAASSIFAIIVAMVPMTMSAAAAPIYVLLQINRVAGSPSGIAGGSTEAGPAPLAKLKRCGPA